MSQKDNERRTPEEKEKNTPETENIDAKTSKKNEETKEEAIEEEPIKPRAAYLLFCDEKRKENKDKKYTVKELAEMYISLPESERQKYIKLHQKLTEEYDVKMIQYFKRQILEEHKKEREEFNRNVKAKMSKKQQRKNEKKACNCGACDECKRKKDDSDDDSDYDSDEDSC